VWRASGVCAGSPATRWLLLQYTYGLTVILRRNIAIDFKSEIKRAKSNATAAPIITAHWKS
jgi:hypothetical protein